MKSLTPEKGLIFRITHVDNVPWILDHGLHCYNSEISDSNYIEIGNPELIAKREHRVVPIPPGGVLSNYVPFYFTPFSPMLYNIKTGWGGVQQRPMREIVILVSSIKKAAESRLEFVFTDRHAYLEAATYFSSDDLGCLDRIDWKILQGRNFKQRPGENGTLSGRGACLPAFTRDNSNGHGML